jgi:hypothetical protein
MYRHPHVYKRPPPPALPPLHPRDISLPPQPESQPRTACVLRVTGAPTRPDVRPSLVHAEAVEGAAWCHTLGGPPAQRRDTPHTQRGQCWVRGPPPVRTDGGALTHGELRCQRSRYDPRTRAQRLRETMTDDGWAGMSEELFEKVLEVLQPAGPSNPTTEAWGSPGP